MACKQIFAVRKRSLRGFHCRPRLLEVDTRQTRSNPDGTPCGLDYDDGAYVRLVDCIYVALDIRGTCTSPCLCFHGQVQT